jgi:hypothetical protein
VLASPGEQSLSRLLFGRGQRQVNHHTLQRMSILDGFDLLLGQCKQIGKPLLNDADDLSCAVYLTALFSCIKGIFFDALKQGDIAEIVFHRIEPLFQPVCRCVIITHHQCRQGKSDYFQFSISVLP